MPGILLATHGGGSAEGAVRVALALAGRLGVPVTPILIYEPLPVDFGYGVTSVPTPEQEEEVRAALVDAGREQLRRAGSSLEPQVRTGVPAAEIAHAARSIEADLIVIGLGPHGIVERALGGETALQLVQVASTPVLAVPAASTAIPSRAVAAIDFSPTSIRAAETVARWLRNDAILHLACVTRAQRASGTGRGRGRQTSLPHPPLPELAESADDRAGVVDRLQKLAVTLPLAGGVCIDEAELTGDPARALMQHLDRVNGDVIALGSHGYGVWKKLLVGSVASKILRVSSKAVLVAPIGCLG